MMRSASAAVTCAASGEGACPHREAPVRVVHLARRRLAARTRVVRDRAASPVRRLAIGMESAPRSQRADRGGHRFRARRESKLVVLPYPPLQRRPAPTSRLFKAVQVTPARFEYSRLMNCAQCDRPATVRIPSSSEAVCADHAVEFWTGLLKFAKEERPTAIAHDEPLWRPGRVTAVARAAASQLSA